MKFGQLGASLLIPVLVIVTVGAFAVIVAASQSGGDIRGTDAQAESIEALFLAETGIERATRRFLTGVACNALTENVTDLSSIGFAGAGRSIAITAGANSGQDFGGAALPATQCRVQVAAQVAASGATRTVQAIIDRSDNLIGTVAIAGFDNPGGVGAPGSWTAGAYDYTGGLPAAGGNPPNCTRAAYAVKARSGGASTSASSIGNAPLSFTVNRPVTLVATFDYRIMRIGNSGSNACTSASGGGACPVGPGLDPTSPENNGDGEICFTLRDTTGATYNSTRVEVDESTNTGLTVSAPACTPTPQRLPTDADYTPCARRYNYSGGTGGGAFSGRVSVRWTFAGGGTLSFDQIRYNLWIPGGGGTSAHEMWIDNIVLQPSTGGTGGIAAWRDCSVTACPAV
jgi:hypothetical protein